MNRKTGSYLLPAIALILSHGCAQQDAAQTPPRPVLAVKVGEEVAARETAFAGEVRARYETKLSFRVPGKVIARRVEVGDRVRKGQLLAQLDPVDYQLASKALASQLSAARTERDFAKDDLARYKELLDQKFISSTDYDRADTRYQTARDRVEALEAQLTQANNQTRYAELHADRDGVITALPVESGQVVTAGQPIATLAQLDEKEVVLSVPEHRIADVRKAEETSVALWVDQSQRLKARVREIAPSADPASRTYSVKLSLLEGKDLAGLGMTATGYFPAIAADQITVPLSALFQPQTGPGQARVWVVDEKTQSVRSVPVKAGATVRDQRVVVSGLTDGQLVVSAGVNRLAEGQKVRLLGDDRLAADKPSAAAPLLGDAASK
jgi:membrane fusion protein, multidrug efflux system